jgi:hypothetical protein
MDIRAFVFFLGWGLVGLTGLIWSLRNLWLALRSKYWNEVDCEIIESDVKTIQLKGKSYRPVISYRYNVNGFDYEGNKIKYGATWGTESVANDYCEKYPAGKIVKVSFDPMNHHRSVLEPGASWRTFGAIILFLAAGAWGLTGILDYLQANH